MEIQKISFNAQLFPMNSELKEIFVCNLNVRAHGVNMNKSAPEV